MLRLAVVSSLLVSAVSPLVQVAPPAPECGPAAGVSRAVPAVHAESSGQFASAVQVAHGMVHADSSLVALYESGQAFPDFLEATRSRRAGWHRITDSVVIADSLVARANAVDGSWRLLVIAIDACGDSMQQVPYVARLAERVDSLDVRIVLPDDGSALQDTHRSLDGRKATPTYLLIDASGNEAGCFVELPREIREWTHARLDSLSRDERYAYRADWYAADKGESVVREVIELMESARAGTPMCDRGE